MRKLIYWCCASVDDDKCYNIRAKTKKEALKQREFRTMDYSKPFKVTVEYKDNFDLLCRCLGEGGIGEYEPESD